MAALKSYAKHLRLLRRRYPAKDAKQREVLDAYANAVEEMEAALANADRSVDLAALNGADDTARWFAMEYWRLRMRNL
jgi:hypothetical protein